MIDKTKKFESAYLKSLEDKFEASLKSFETISLEQCLTETEDSIREIPRKQDEAIADRDV